MTLLTIKEAAAALKVSRRHIDKLIEEADTTPKTARWKFGRELIDLTPAGSTRRTIRVALPLNWLQMPASAEELAQPSLQSKSDQ